MVKLFISRLMVKRIKKQLFPVGYLDQKMSISLNPLQTTVPVFMEMTSRAMLLLPGRHSCNSRSEGGKNNSEYR